MWYGKGKAHADKFAFYARNTWEIGMVSVLSACTRLIDNIKNEITLQLLSTEASERKARLCLSNTGNVQPSVQVPTTPSASLLNKGKSRQLSSLSEESPLQNGSHSMKSLDTEPEKSSGPSTSDASGCLLNELPSSESSHLPLYSEADISDAISVNLEDDTEGDLGSDLNSIAPEKVRAKYNLLVCRQITEEQCKAWASQVFSTRQTPKW